MKWVQKESKVQHNKGKFAAEYRGKNQAIKDGSKTNKKINNITIIYFRAPSLEQKKKMFTSTKYLYLSQMTQKAFP